jgi:hypothetical protein
MTVEDKVLLADSMDMFSDGNDRLTGSTQETAPAPRAETASTSDADRVRDDQGRFAPKEVAKPDATPQQQTQAPAVNADADPEKQPITKAEFKGMLEEREKRQAAQARADAAEARLRQIEDQQRSQIPSDTDPDVAQKIQGARADAIFTTSEMWATKEHGAETVKAAMDWALQRAQQNPAFAAEYFKQPHPIDWAVKQQKRDRILNEIGDDPDAFIEARIAARLGQAGTPQTQAAPLTQAASPQPASLTPQTPAPTRSIANATSAGGASVVPPWRVRGHRWDVHKH